MNTLALVVVTNRITAFNPIEFDGIRTLGLWAKPGRPGSKPLEVDRFKTEAGQMRTLLAEPNPKRQKA